MMERGSRPQIITIKHTIQHDDRLGLPVRKKVAQCAALTIKEQVRATACYLLSGLPNALSNCANRSREIFGF